MDIAASGFRATRLVPLNDAISPDWIFSPSKTTDIPVSEYNENTNRPLTKASEARSSNSMRCTPKISEEGNKNKSSAEVSKMIQDLSPLPQLQRKSNLKRPRKGKLGILNNTPDIEEQKIKTREKQKKKTGSQLKQQGKI